MKKIELTEDQRVAYKSMMSGKNVFLTGEAGTGKSFVLEMFIRDSKKNLLITAPTGIAAINIDGATCHRTFGLKCGPIEPSPMEEVRVPKIVQSADVIIIDEISMLRCDGFQTIAQIILKDNRKRIKNGEKEIQLIVCGDFLQLPPVVKEDREVLVLFYEGFQNGYAFESEYWKKFEFITHELTEVVRQDDVEFIKNLNKCRRGDKTSLEYFKKNSCQTENTDAICLFPRNRDANEYNHKILEELKGDIQCYHSTIIGDVSESDKMTLDMIKLKKGARVMLSIYN